MSGEKSSLEQAREWIAGARRIVGFTGAGISTESNIPDFRSPNGYWSRNRVIYFQEFVSDEAARIEAWRQKVETWPAIRDAQPNPGHKAFVELAQRGQLHALITQNIDRLHQRAGLDPKLVLEIHGTTTEAACLRCAVRISMDEAVDRIANGDAAPRCTACGGLLKPATISFGQALPEDLLLRCQDAARSCDVFIAAGSSLVVYPAAALPALAKQSGARLIIINRTETPLDDAADFVLRGEIGLTLPTLAAMAGHTDATHG
jgi:NAD-dependent deacetylase